jgi:hypothetical protein
MRYLFAASLLATALGACGDGSGPSDLIPAELEGSWEAAPSCLPNCGFTLIRIDNPADSVNFVSSLEQTFLLTLTGSGRFGLTAVGGGSTIRGRVHAEGTMLILRDEAGTQDTADYTLSGEYLGLAFRGVATQFDFDADGIGDPSMVRARFRRQ